MFKKQKKEQELITEGVNVPVSLNRLTEFKIKNHPWFVVATWGILFLISVGISIILISSNVPAIPAIIVPGVFTFLITIAKFRTRKQVLRSYYRILLLYRLLSKNSTFNKHKLSLDSIKRWIPVEAIEKTGLVRLKNGTSMFIIMLNPPRNAATDLNTYNKRILNIVNTLHGKFSYQFLAISKRENKNHLEKTTANILNEDHPKQIMAHSYSIYDFAIKKVNSGFVPDWDYILFVHMPKTKSIEEAERLKNSLENGLLQELANAKILANTISDHDDCIRLLRMLFTGAA